MADGKVVNGANSFKTPGVTICIPPIIGGQPDVIGFNACVSLPQTHMELVIASLHGLRLWRMLSTRIFHLIVKTIMLLP